MHGHPNLASNEGRYITTHVDTSCAPGAAQTQTGSNSDNRHHVSIYFDHYGYNKNYIWLQPNKGLLKVKRCKCHSQGLRTGGQSETPGKEELDEATRQQRATESEM